MPKSRRENERANPAHHNAEGGRSMGRQTSSVTAPGFLCPAMSGIRSGEQTSGILLVLLSHDLEVVHRRPDVQLFQNAILPAIPSQPGDAAVRIVEISEDDCTGGARLLARGANIAVLNRRAGA